MMQIRPFRAGDEEQVVALWRRCGLVRPWNDPRKDIAAKLREQPELFLVGTVGDEVVASAMAGYDGHRGWINYVAVAPERRGAGHGRAIMEHAERLLRERGCPKVCLQIRRENAEVAAFYAGQGYREDDVISMGKRLDGSGSGRE
jgi:ribosomal protein S18 acetylase RimI-like enzyme